MQNPKTVKDYIRTIPDFPHEGIMFRDVTTLFADATQGDFASRLTSSSIPMPGPRSTCVARARGARVHPRRGDRSPACPSVSCRSARRASCRARPSNRPITLEYGDAVVGAPRRRDRNPAHGCWSVDDLLATGGTAEAGIRLIERLGADVAGCAFVIDLPELGGRKRLSGARDGRARPLCAFEGA